jgi:glycosyltransferase involved in cell wall biosynthesis
LGYIFTSLIISIIILFFINLIFAIANIFVWSTEGINAIFLGLNLTERIIYSTYFKWIIIADVIWFILALIFVFSRKQYKTNSQLYYLTHKPIIEPKICVIIPAYNEEPVIEKVVKDFINQKNVESVFVIDNHSSDNTAKIAERCGAEVIRKNKNMGYAHSCVLGLKKSLETNANIIALTEADGTYSGIDLEKMIPYIENVDMVIGTREIQVLSEKGNQNKTFYVWGNFLLAKLIQIKFFSLQHMGVVSLTDVGCSYRCIRREALSKIIDQFTHPETGEVVVKPKSGLFALFMTMTGIKNNLRVVEIPITFKKRIGISKTESDKTSKAIKYAIEFFWYILSS